MFIADLELQEYDKLFDLNKHVMNIRDGFVNHQSESSYAPVSTVPLDEPLGRKALASMLSICENTLRLPRYRQYIKLDTTNLGGSDPYDYYDGNCTYAVIKEKADDWMSDDDFMSILERTPIPKREYDTKAATVKTSVPDVQLCTFRMCHGNPQYQFNLTAQVKSTSMSRQESIHQTWTQALIGLTHSDTSYALLLRPKAGVIYKLSIQEAMDEAMDENTYKTLFTSTRSWSFIRTDEDGKHVFDADNFINFLRAIIDIMLKAVESE